MTTETRRAIEAAPASDQGDTGVELTVVLPCLNEAETLERCLLRASGSAADLGVDLELIVADNGSTDGSPEIARRAGARVVHVPTRGYGAALDAGIQAAVNATPLKRGGTPADVAGAVIYFVSELGSFITGEILEINGGLYFA